MIKILKLAIIDDNIEIVKQVTFEINKYFEKELNVYNMYTGNKETLYLIKKENPDIILLDLNMSGLTGIEILEEIQINNLKSKVIVISGESTLILNAIKKYLPIYKTLIKPFEISILIDTLNDLLKYSNYKNNIQNVLENILDNFYFNKSNLGYSYILDCLEICINQEHKQLPKTKNIYDKVANKHGISNIKNIYSIRWNIDKCIRVMNDLTPKEKIIKFFPYNSKPSTKTFLNQILKMAYIDLLNN